MINQSDFISKYYPAISDVRRKSLENFLDRFDALIEDEGMSLQEALADKNVLCSTFFMARSDVSALSRATYQTVKSYLLNLGDYAGMREVPIPTREEVINSHELIGFFRNITSLLSFIDEVGETCLQNYDPTRDLVRVKAVCVLGWLGFSLSEIAVLKKADLQRKDNDCYIITSSTGRYEVMGKPFTVLYYLCDLEEYYGVPSGKKISLKSNDEYLFRAREPEIEHLSENGLILLIKRFNSSVPSSMRGAIVFRKLRKNALFSEILYYDPPEEQLIDKIMEIMECGYMSALNYKQQYLRFAAAVKSGEI